MALFAELRRRKVFRAAAAYLIAAWIVMQVADVVSPALRLPDWVPTLVVFLLIIGFPIALVLAWAYDLTPEGLQRATGDTAKPSAAPVRGRRLELAIIALLAVAVGLLAYDRWRSPATDTDADIATGGGPVSIAVLPFDNLSTDTRQQYFADGLTEELLNVLSALDGLRVVSRTSSFTLRDPATPLGEIGRTLGVSHVVDGSVRLVGDRLRINAQLVDAVSDTPLWSESYDEQLTVDNVIEIQESIARRVAATLEVRLLPGQALRSGTDRPANLEAFDAYLNGMSGLRQVEIGSADLDTFAQAIADFESSIAADPDWVPPRAALGRVLHFRGSGFGRRADLARSREVLEVALSLDPDYGRTLSSLAFLDMVDLNFESSKQYYERAASQGENIGWGMALLHAHMGQFDEAVKWYREAIRHDPLSWIIKVQMAETMVCAGQYDEAATRLRALESQLSEDGFLKAALAEALAKAGQRNEAERYAELAAGMLELPQLVANAWVASGRNDRARALLDAAVYWDSRLTLRAARAELALGNETRGRELLARAAGQLDGVMTRLHVLYELRCGTEFQAVSHTPEYQRLMQQIEG